MNRKKLGNHLKTSKLIKNIVLFSESFMQF